jgi:hypothetical protein
MTTFKRLFAIVPLTVSLSACGSDNQKVDLGDDGKPGSTAQGLAAYEGTWDGYAEAYHFDQGSDRVRVTLDSAGNGTIRLGDAPEIAPFSNPAIGYPEDLPFTDEAFSFSYLPAHAGFAYPVLDASVESGRLHFDFWGSDIVKAWCEAQTPYPDGGTPAGNYSCNPGGSGFGQSGGVCYNEPEVVVDCGFVKTCLAACSCNAQGCHATRYKGSGLELDGVLENDGDTLVGTLVVLGGSAPERITIRLTR